MSVSKGEYKGVMQIIAAQIEKTNKHWHQVRLQSQESRNLSRRPTRTPATSWRPIFSSPTSTFKA